MKGFFPNLTGENPYFVLMPAQKGFICTEFVMPCCCVWAFACLFYMFA